MGVGTRGPRQLGQPREDDALVVGEDGRREVVLARRVQVVVDQVVAVDESRGDEPVIGLDGFIVVVAS